MHIREGATEPCDTWCVMLRESCEFGGYLGLGVWTGDVLVVGCEKLVHSVSSLNKGGKKNPLYLAFGINLFLMS